MINIINRFYDIKSGVVKINDKSIYDIDLNNLRENISLINQDVFLFSSQYLITLVCTIIILVNK